MEKKHIIILVGCIVGVTGLLLGLYATSSLTEDIYRASFNRVFASEPLLIKKAEVDLKHNSFYIAGIDGENIYIGNYTNPFLLTVVDKSLSEPKRINLKVIGLDSIMEPRYFRLAVDSQYFFLTHGVMPIILKGKTGEWKAELFKTGADDYFDQSVPLGPASFALRSYSNLRDGYELAKKASFDTISFRFKYGLLEKQGDGIFSVDGKLHFNKRLRKLVYLYTYRNQYVVSDTNLNLLYRGNTIDTFSNARVKVAHIESSNSYMIAAPPVEINKNSCVSGKFLFVESNLLANNENKRKFLDSSIIDIYDLSNSSYSFSFYIDKHRDKKLSSFRVFNNNLLVVFGDYLVMYEFNRFL